MSTTRNHRPAHDDPVAVSFKISRTVRDRFSAVCKANGDTASNVYQDAIEDYLTKHDHTTPTT